LSEGYATFFSGTDKRRRWEGGNRGLWARSFAKEEGSLRAWGVKKKGGKRGGRAKLES